jgi:phosphoribosylanthranilate isomerase
MNATAPASTPSPSPFAGDVPHRTRVKLCGLSRESDVELAVELGADAIGLVFYPQSPRFVGVAEAIDLVKRLPPFVSAVGLFVNASPEWMSEVTSNVPLTMLQFHGDETPAQCEVLANVAGLPWLRALRVGADAIGLVFYPQSPRFVGVAEAIDLVKRLPPFVSAVGLFVNASPEWMSEVTSNVPLTMLQFHGDETPAQCEVLANVAGLPWLRALRVGADTKRADLVESALNYSAAGGLLFDTHVEGYGGGGKIFDWSLIPEELGRRAVLSGGLNAQNVGDAIRRVRPFAVDVSSGIEVPGAKGVKDPARMAAFVRAVRDADAG